jgi:hypothetical protein
VPLPQVSIEIAAPAAVDASRRSKAEAAAAAALRETLLKACTAAAEAAECVVADPENETSVLALVFWRGPERVHIELGSRSRKAPWATRELEFTASDPVLERWRAAGYTVGVLAAENLAAEQAASPAGDQPPSTAAAAGTAGAPSSAAETGVAPAPAPSKPPPSAAEDVPRSGAAPAPAEVGGRSHSVEYRWSFAAGAALGTGLNEMRSGAVLRVSRSFAGPFATGAAAYTVAGRDDRGISGHWITLSAGGGYEIPTPWFSVDVRAEIAAEQLTAHIEEPASGQSDSASRWVASLCAGAEVVRVVVMPVAVFLGVEGVARTNRTDVQVGNAVATADPPFGVSLIGGVRVLIR